MPDNFVPSMRACRMRACRMPAVTQKICPVFPLGTAKSQLRRTLYTVNCIEKSKRKRGWEWPI